MNHKQGFGSNVPAGFSNSDQFMTYPGNNNSSPNVDSTKRKNLSTVAHQFQYDTATTRALPATPPNTPDTGLMAFPLSDALNHTALDHVDSELSKIKGRRRNSTFLRGVQAIGDNQPTELQRMVQNVVQGLPVVNDPQDEIEYDIKNADKFIRDEEMGLNQTDEDFSPVKVPTIGPTARIRSVKKQGRKGRPLMGRDERERHGQENAKRIDNASGFNFMRENPAVMQLLETLENTKNKTNTNEEAEELLSNLPKGFGVTLTGKLVDANGRVVGRQLVPWHKPRMYEKFLFCLLYELHRRGHEIPWDQVVHRLHPGSSGQSAQQALNKLREVMIVEGHFVPPLLGKVSQYIDEQVRGFVRDMASNNPHDVRVVMWDEKLDHPSESLQIEGLVKGSGNYRKSSVKAETPKARKPARTSTRNRLPKDAFQDQKSKSNQKLFSRRQKVKSEDEGEDEDKDEDYGSKKVIRRARIETLSTVAQPTKTAPTESRGGYHLRARTNNQVYHTSFSSEHEQEEEDDEYVPTPRGSVASLAGTAIPPVHSSPLHGGNGSISAHSQHTQVEFENRVEKDRSARHSTWNPGTQKDFFNANPQDMAFDYHSDEPDYDTTPVKSNPVYQYRTGYDSPRANVRYRHQDIIEQSMQGEVRPFNSPVLNWRNEGAAGEVDTPTRHPGHNTGSALFSRSNDFEFNYSPSERAELNIVKTPPMYQRFPYTSHMTTLQGEGPRGYPHTFSNTPSNTLMPLGINAGFQPNNVDYADIQRYANFAQSPGMLNNTNRLSQSLAGTTHTASNNVDTSPRPNLQATGFRMGQEPYFTQRANYQAERVARDLARVDPFDSEVLGSPYRYNGPSPNQANTFNQSSYMGNTHSGTVLGFGEDGNANSPAGGENNARAYSEINNYHDTASDVDANTGSSGHASSSPNSHLNFLC